MKDQGMWNKERERIQSEAKRLQNLWNELEQISLHRREVVIDPEFGRVEWTPQIKSQAAST